MTAVVQDRGSALGNKKKTITTSVLAGIGALGLALVGPLAAHAATITEADRDIAEVSYLDEQLVVWGHDHDTNTGFDPEADVYVVGNAYPGGGYFLDEEEAEGEVSLGVAAEDTLFEDLGGVTTGSRTVTYHFTVSSAPGGGELTLWEGSSSPVIETTGTDSFTVTLVDGVEFHRHYNWLFSQAGDYEVTIWASANAGADPSDPVTVTFDVG